MALSKRIWPSDRGDIITTSYIVHRFYVSDAEDPDIYAAGPMFDWERSEAGGWIMANAYDKPSWHRQRDYNSYGYKYIIKADLTPEQITFFELKYK
jgi:hypothetical protein